MASWEQAFRHRGGRLRLPLAAAWTPGERHRLDVDYAGPPKVSAEPPWLDGFVWQTTASGAPWIALSTQVDGADLWLPVKDHPSDEPDEGATIALTVPAGLVGLSNGRSLGATANADGTVTSRWRVHYPINAYLLTLNVAPYVGDARGMLIGWQAQDLDLDARIDVMDGSDSHLELIAAAVTRDNTGMNDVVIRGAGRMTGHALSLEGSPVNAWLPDGLRLRIHTSAAHDNSTWHGVFDTVQVTDGEQDGRVTLQEQAATLYKLTYRFAGSLPSIDEGTLRHAYDDAAEPLLLVTL